ncbi:MAG: DUF503 domain-containing protein [Magnetococcales bacterium]|nr:DUF503 domain-containing protein [Magnetococcales bacterium]
MLHVAVLEVRLDLPGVRSLKEKRGIVKSLLERLRHRFQVAVAEVAHQDHWQTAGLGVAAIGNDVAVLQGWMQKVVQFIETDGSGVVVVDFRLEFLA